MADIYGNPYGPGASYHDGQWWPATAGASPSAAPLGSTTPGASGMNGQLQEYLNQLRNAIAGGSQDNYDIALGKLLGVFQGSQPTLDLRKEEETAREANLTAEGNLLSTASKLNGPANYADFLQYTGGGQDVAHQLQNGRPASGAPTSTIAPMDLPSLMQQLGMLTPGSGQPAAGSGAFPDPFAGVPGGAPAQKIAGGGGATRGNEASTPTTPLKQMLLEAILGHLGHSGQPGAQVGGGGYDSGGADPLSSNVYALRMMGLQGQDPTGSMELSNPGGNIDPAKWDQLGKAGQQFFVAGAQKYGWDPNTFLEQIDAQRPQGSAYGADMTRAVYAPMSLAS